MALADRLTGRQRRRGGRRRNYEPSARTDGIYRLVPIGWENWIGSIMFGLISSALFIEFLFATQRGTNDWIPAGLLCPLFLFISYMFATNRVRD